MKKTEMSRFLPYKQIIAYYINFEVAKEFFGGIGIISAVFPVMGMVANSIFSEYQSILNVFYFLHLTLLLNA